MTVDFNADPENKSPDQGNQADQNQTKETVRTPANQESQDQGFLEYNGKKLSREDVLKKVQNADEHIKRLEEERQQDRQKQEEILQLLKQATNAEGLLGKLKAQQGQPKDEAETQGAFDEDALITRATKRLREEIDLDQKKAVLDSNWKDVTTELTRRYGSKVNEQVASVAAENGLTVQQAADLAKSSPKVFLKLFPNTPAPERGVLGNRRSNNPAAKPAAQGQSLFRASTISEQVDIYTQRLQAALNKG